MKQCFAVKERHAVIPDSVVHMAASAAQAEHVCTVKNNDHIKRVQATNCASCSNQIAQRGNRFYVGITRMT